MVVRASFITATVFCSCPAWANDPYQYMTLDCNFTKSVVTTLENKKFQTVNKEDNLAITFSGFDAKKGEALLMGNAGADRVLYVRGDKKVMLVQFTESGNGTMTSISDPRNGVSIAFHSRHVWMLGEPIVSHYHTGVCQKR